MRFSFVDEAGSIENSKIIHIIEHGGYGTLHQLIEPLQEDLQQHVICTYNLASMKFIRKHVHYIMHTTGNLYPIISNLKLLLDNRISVSIFLHVAPKYFELKQKSFFLDYLSDIQSIYGLQCFCPSKEVALQYKSLEIDVKSIQIGFPDIDINVNQHKFILNTYCNKYITICTSPDPRYIYLKGLNEFINIMEKNNKVNESLILGFDGKYRGVNCKKFQLEDFLYILGNAKAYIQLSITEAYNLTAVQAKRLRVPVIVSDVDGHKDCMKNFCNRLKSEEEFCEKIKLVSDINCIDQNYEDSIRRETTENFIFSIKNNVYGGKIYE